MSKHKSFTDKLIDYYEQSKRLRDKEIVSKMHPDNLAEGIEQYHPTLVQHWRNEGIDILSNILVDSVKMKLKYYISIKNIEQNSDSYELNVLLSGYQIHRILSKE